jgi:hypothetical protein
MITHTQQLIISSTKLNKKSKTTTWTLILATTLTTWSNVHDMFDQKFNFVRTWALIITIIAMETKGITQTKTLNHVQRKLVIRMQWPPKRCHHCSSHCIWTPIVSALVFDIPGTIPGVNPYTRPSLDGVLQKSCHFVVYFKLRLLPGFFLCIWYVYCTRQPSIPDLLWYIRSVSSIQIHVQNTYAPGELGGTTEHGNLRHRLQLSLLLRLLLVRWLQKNGLFGDKVLKTDCRTCDVCFDFLRTADTSEWRCRLVTLVSFETLLRTSCCGGICCIRIFPT